MKSFAKKLFRRFGGEMMLTSHLFSRDTQTSKDIHRVYALVKFPAILAGDIVMYRKRLLRVTSVQGKKVSCRHVDADSGISFVLGRDDYKLIAKKSKTLKTRISKTKPLYEVLDPNTFQSIPVVNQNSCQGLRPGQKVRVVYNNGIWIV